MRRRRAIAGGVVLAGAVVGGLAVAGVGSGVAPDTTVAGVDLGRPAPQVTSDLVTRARALVSRPIDVRAGGEAVTVVSPRELGARPLIGRTLAQAHGDDPNLLLRGLRRATGQGPEQKPLLVSYPAGRLERWVAGLAEMIDRPSQPGLVLVSGPKLKVVGAESGRHVDQAALVSLMSRDLSALPAVLHVPIGDDPPVVSTDQAERAAAAGRAILARPATVQVGRRTALLPTAAVANALRFVGDQAVLDPGALRGPLGRAFRGLERPARSARLVPQDDTVRLVTARAGVRVDAKAVADGLAGEARPVTATLETQVPRVQTAAVRALHIRERVGSFTTSFLAGEPRVTNITRAAQILDGKIIHPGQRFSLNAALGERTTQRGFVEAPMLADSLDVLAVGGGVSQVATTLFNAAFLAGLDIPEHTAHGLYIGRYPLGRDATISWGGPDLVIRNDWPDAVLIHTGVSADAITISLYSTSDGRRIETTTSEPYAKTKPPERLIQNPDLDPKAKILQQTGSDGFGVDVTRKVYRGNELIRDESFTTVYSPYPKLYSVGVAVPGGEAPPVAPES